MKAQPPPATSLREAAQRLAFQEASGEAATATEHAARELSA